MARQVTRQEKKRAMTETVSIHDEGPGDRYFHIMLNMADDELDPYEYRLLGHYRRVCGARNVPCTESTRVTAERCKMSAGKVSETRQRLAQLGWITLFEDGNRVVVTLVDRMPENVQRYSAAERSQGERSPREHNVHQVNDMAETHDERSPHEQDVHQVNESFTTRTNCSPGERAPYIEKQQKPQEPLQTTPPAAPASPPTAAQPAAPAAGGVDGAAESSGDDDLAFILPAVRRLHLSAEAQQRLLALGAQTALAIAFAATAPGVRNPAGLAVRLMDNGGPSEFDLERAALALKLRTLDTQELDRHQHRREYERLAQQAEERWAAEQERNASAPPVAAGASPGDDGLDYRPGGGPMTLRDWWRAVLDDWERRAGHPVKPAVPLRYADGVLTVQVGLTNLHWWQTRAEQIGQTLSRWLGESVRLEVVLSDEDRAARERFEKLMAEVLGKRQPTPPVTGESTPESEASPQAEPDEGEQTEAAPPVGAAAVVLPAAPEPVQAEPTTASAEADSIPAAVEDPGEPLPPPPPELDPAALPGLWQQTLAVLREQELPFSLAEISRLQVAGYAEGVVTLRAATARDYQWLEGRGLTLGYVQNVLRGQAGESLQIRLLPPDPLGAQEQEVVRA